MSLHRFSSMGCEIAVLGARPEKCAAIEGLFADRDRVFSRFRAGSELNRVNGSAGRLVRVSPLFAEMLQLSLEAARETAGLVDLTVGAALEAAGYDLDFPLLRDDDRAAGTGQPGSWQAVRVIARHVLVPHGVRLDLNGVVKGKTVDDALALLEGDGFVSAGGDLAARGGAVAALPAGGTVRLVRGALATSGTDRRRWRRDGAVQHHLIDPRTGAPSRSPWSQVTVSGATCVGADVAAKAAFLLGDDGPDWLDARGIPGRFVSEPGSVHSNGSWRSSLGQEPVCT